MNVPEIRVLRGLPDEEEVAAVLVALAAVAATAESPAAQEDPGRAGWAVRPAPPCGSWRA
ncbi:acyl-CoA carboxylase epsilon subunit [Amycolatopsis sp.]|uniref:acyl-CoA carboxylase epsilon subunit n=1 Tax=Amycolatopsis sp. TaxID=37632 RepID=UPI002CA1B022|nr:acyl-CoA carboxylase epsilon subunit [Amycolatopsis sp.]HVV11375.1 acyl-CoA carboxylase epsilon subunit [Amycolatopsis sp.]